MDDSVWNPHRQVHHVASSGGVRAPCQGQDKFSDYRLLSSARRETTVGLGQLLRKERTPLIDREPRVLPLTLPMLMSREPSLPSCRGSRPDGTR